MLRIYPSLISANFLHLAEEIERLEPYCNGFHLDIMDNHFVPHLSFGADITNAIATATTKQLWVHLMVDDPASWCDQLELPAQTLVSFHIESTQNAGEIITRIREKKWTAGIAIKPKTNVNELFPFLLTIDHVLIMSVEPGFSGQRFLPSAVNMLKTVVARRKEKKLSFVIGMDGGINHENIKMLAHEGVQDFAIASAIFGQADPVETIKRLKKAA